MQDFERVFKVSEAWIDSWPNVVKLLKTPEFKNITVKERLNIKA